MNVVPRLPVIRAGDRNAARSVFLILLALFTLGFSGLPDNPDAEVEFQTTRSLAREGRLALGDTPEARRIVELRFDVAHGGPGRENEWYSWFGVGQALTGVPFYWVGAALARAWPELEERHAESSAFGAPRSEYFAHLLVGWRNPLLTAWTAALLVSTALRLGSRRWHAWLVGLSYGLCTFAWPQARSTLSDVQATFLLFLAFHQLVRVRETLLRLAPPRALTLSIAGAALGGAVLTRVLVLPAATVLLLAALVLLVHGRRRLPPNARGSVVKPVAALVTPALVCAALFLFLNQTRFGSPFETGYSAGMGPDFFSYPVHYGLAGLLAAPGKGLIWMAPGLLLVPFGWYRSLHVGHRLWAWTLVPLSMAVLIPPAMTATWHGAWTYGPRYVLPLLPFLWLGVGYALGGRHTSPWVRRFAAALFLFGSVVQVPAVLVDTMTHHDLATQAARERWPDGTLSAAPGLAEEDAELARFIAIQWDWGLAAPWAHWRILRHRVAGLGERFSAREIFRFDSDTEFEPAEERQREFRHLAWVDLTERLGGTPLPAVASCCLLLAAGAILAYRNVDPRAF